MATKVQTFRKDPQAVLDYGFDWSDWLESGEIIDTSTWSVAIGITEDSNTKDNDSTKIWLSGGTDGETYLIANKIITDGGRTDERTFEILVENR